MRGWVKRHEGLVAGVWGLAMVFSMLSYGFVGAWMYGVFLALGLPLAAMTFFGDGVFAERNRDALVMSVIVLIFAAVGAYALLTRGYFIDPGDPRQEASTSAAEPSSRPGS